MGKRSNRDRIFVFGENWIEKDYYFDTYFRTFYDENIDMKVFFTIRINCEFKTSIGHSDHTYISLLLNIKHKEYIKKAIEYGSDKIYFSNPYWSDEKKCEQFMEEYIKKELMVPLQVMQALIK